MRTTKPTLLHGYQIWVALPKALEEMTPQFDFYKKTELPSWNIDALRLRVVAGTAFGKSSPLQGFSPLFMVDIFAKKQTTLQLKGQVEGEIAFVVVKGSISSNNEKVLAGQMLISKTDNECEICIDDDSQILLFGGEPLPEERYLLWNFVSHDKTRLQSAKEDWIAKKFPVVPNDDTYIPIPDYSKK